MKAIGKQGANPAEMQGTVTVQSIGIVHAAAESPGAGEHASKYCPVCSKRLESRRCKLICTVCGYYMSCADYY